MISQQQWLQSRKKLLRQVKSEVELRLGPQPLSLRRYAKNLDREFSGRWLRCPMKALEKSIHSAQVVLGSDFHAYAQSQRAHIRLLRSLPSRRPVVLALECLSFAHNRAIQAFLRGQLSEIEFLNRVEWEEHWGFPWAHYRPLLELAKVKGFSVEGLNPPQLDDLKARDQWTARRLREIHEAQPEALIYVVMGEWHLAQKHLPQLVRRQLGRKARVVTILQDSEDLYFRLAKERREETTDCLRRPGDRFCVMVSPPWMKWQSYLMFLEQTYDRDLRDDLDYSDHVSQFVRILQRDLKVSVDHTRLHVYTASSKATLRRLNRGGESQMMRYLLEHDRSFMLPSGLLYLSRPTINHAAALSGQYVHAQMCERTRPLWNLPSDFYGLIWTEGVGFFFSKWINPKRKSENLDSLRLQLQAAAPSDQGREALLLALEQQIALVLWLKSKRLRTPSFKPKQKFSYVEAARILGSVLGEKLYQKVRGGAISLHDLKALLRLNVESAEFVDRYWSILDRVER